MNQYAVIANLELDGTSSYTMATLPLHVTLLSIFYSEAPVDQLARIVRDVSRGGSAFTSRTTSRALYGVNEDIPVTLVEKTGPLADLHQQLLQAVTDLVVFREPRFTGENFGPHITDQSGRAFPLDEEVCIDNLSLVEITGEEVSVICVYLFRCQT